MILPVLHHDDWLLVVNKPSGMLVHNGWARERDVALRFARHLAGRYVYPVHRLDRGTSGVLIFALSSELARAMQQVLGCQATVKRYLALVRGVTPLTGRIRHALAKQKGAEKKEAATDFFRLGVFERYSLIAARPLTGRLHQVRRHMKHISHPLIGDVRYGKSEHNRLLKARVGLARLALHASSYSFVHPVTGHHIVVRAPMPDDMREPLLRMGFSEALASELNASP